MRALRPENNLTGWEMAFLFLFSAVLVGFAGRSVGAQASSADLHQTYDLAAGGTVTVSNYSGHIHITSWNENRVRVDGVKRGQNAAEVDQGQIQVNSTPGSIVVRVIQPRLRDGRGSSGDISVDLEVKVPRSAILGSITSTSGEIRVVGPVAQLTARTVSGAIDARDVVGPTSLTSNTGTVTSRKTGGDSGDTIVNTTSGPATVEQPGARASVRSQSGSISVTGAGAEVNADSAQGPIVIAGARGRVTSTSLNGSISVRDALEGVTSRTVGAPITLSNIKGRVSAVTLDGPITLRLIDSADVYARTTSGSILYDGKIASAGRYSFETFNGLLQAILPPESQFNLSARTFNGSINTEFPIEIEPGSIGGERQIRGTAGRGGAELITTAFNGRIEIKKAKNSAKP